MPAQTKTARSERLLNRELSWLDFNARVLELAGDQSLPLLEQIKFCAIFSSNLDEFFMVRVAGLIEQAASGFLVRSADGLTAQTTLAAIRTRVLELTAQQSKLWRGELKPALAAEGIEVGRVDDCGAKELRELEARFTREIFPVLTPLGVGPGQPFPYISGLSLSLGVLAHDAESGEERFARVKIPEGLPRFFSVGGHGLLIPVENVIAHFVPQLFPGMEVAERTSFRVTRNADFELSDEADDLLEAVELELRRRRFGEVVRVEVASSMSEAMLSRLVAGLRVTPAQVYKVHGPLDLADLAQIAALERPDLKDEPWPPVTQPRLLRAGADEFFAQIRRADLLVHQPYESFATSFEAFARAASSDPGVIAMKTAMYRTSDDSPLVPALIDCAEDGKQSVCLVELKARFDERRNIEWSRALEKAGVHVVYGFPDLKIHAKMTLVVRREGDVMQRYVHIGTGNYHALTARTYEDIGIFTADEDIAADVADLFNYLTGFGRPQQFRKLLVAPFSLRERLIEEIRAVGRAAADGKPARIRLKLNALTDEAIIAELVRAARHGAQVDVVARSICMLCPDPEVGTITVRSILGRFLEHSRLYLFDADQRSSVYLGSADLMPRNLDRRVEILMPVESVRLRQELSAVFESALADNTFAWELLPDGTWRRLSSAKGERPHTHQEALMRRVRARARRAGARSRNR